MVTHWSVDTTYISDDTPVEDWGKLRNARMRGLATYNAPDFHAAVDDSTGGYRTKFRVYDDDGVLYFSGVAWLHDDSTGFEPLDHFMATHGCTTIKYWEQDADGKFGWQIL